MRLNISFNDFRRNHLRKKNQILFRSLNCNQYFKVENLYKFLLAEKNSFIFESVEKGTIRGRYTIIGLNPDKIWDIYDNVVILNNEGKRSKIKINPLKYLNKLIKEFKIELPKQLPSMASMLVGYFSYDIIRYVEKIPNKCKDDLKIPDVRLSRPKNLVIYDNLKKKYTTSKIFMLIQKLKIIVMYITQYLKNLICMKVLEILNCQSNFHLNLTKIALDQIHLKINLKN